MRVGLVIHRLSPRRGGAEVWTWALAQWLRREGHEVHLLAHSVDSIVSSDAYQIHTLPGSRSRFAAAAAAHEQIERLALDVVHDMGCGYTCDIFQPHCGSQRVMDRARRQSYRSWQRPWMHLAHYVLPRYRAMARLASRQFANRDCLFLAVSARVAGDLEYAEGIPPERIRTIYNGVDVQAFSPELCAEQRSAMRARLGLRDSDRVALLVAHHHRLKGVNHAIEALQPFDDWRLLVVGGTVPWWHGPVVADPRVRYFAATDTILPYYAAADVYLHPTYYDACSLVVLEAMACGLPVCTTRANGVSDLLTHERDGVVIAAPDDLLAMRRFLVRARDDEYRHRMGLAARNRACQQTLEQNLRQVVELYRECSSAGLRRRSA